MNIILDQNVEEILSDMEQLIGSTYPNINRETAEYLYNLVIERKPGLIVEVGACNGYSTIWLSLAAQSYGGRVVTYEWNPKRCNELRENLVKADVAEVTEIREVDAKQDLTTFDSQVDFAFIDATKNEYLEYFRLIEPHLSDDALVVADNVISHKDKLQDFLDYVKTSGTYESKTIDIGKGIELIEKQ